MDDVFKLYTLDEMAALEEPKKPNKHWMYHDNMTITCGGYEIDLERITTSAAMLDWIFQVQIKTWATPEVMAELINTLADLLDPQANYCSCCLGGKDMGKVANPKAILNPRKK